MLLARYPHDAHWIGELLMPQLILWNRWWAVARQYSTASGSKNVTDGGGILAPGSTRANIKLAISCANQSPLLASRCETGLDNSPLYDGATFVVSEDVIDSVDVGMTALYARDCLALAKVCRMLGTSFDAFALEFERRGTAIVSTINREAWNNEASIYGNKLWATNTWFPVEKGELVVGPPNLYPMLARAPTDAQAERMLQKYVVNTSQFAVEPATAFGMPSISRTSSAFADNSYWRGRTWGPMNMLVYLGLREYQHLPTVRRAMADLARQSEATFLVEWIPNHRVMENFNSVNGKGCDVTNAIPFYHWGALLALVALMEAGGLNATTGVGVVIGDR
jgi:hypothetical protein